MAITIKLLAEGRLGTTAGNLYIVPTGATAIIKTITIVNTGSASAKINLYVVKAGKTARHIIPKDMELNSQYSLIFDDELTLGAGDKIIGSSTSSNTVDYTVMGVEKTQ